MVQLHMDVVPQDLSDDAFYLLREKEDKVTQFLQALAPCSYILRRAELLLRKPYGIGLGKSDKIKRRVQLSGRYSP